MAASLQNDWIRYGKENWLWLVPDEWPGEMPYPWCVRYKALHRFHFHANKVFLRSLFLRANAVHQISKDLPDPTATPEVFQDYPSIQDKLSAFFERQVDDADSVVIQNSADAEE